MTNESGGVLAANPREGFRSETLAQFALSAFGPATAVEVSEDHGIDLVCATAKRVGRRLHVGGGYAVQVKSDDETDVVYEGPHARDWLDGLGSPLFICRVDKASTRIRLYSTWSVARVLLDLSAYGRTAARFRLLMDAEVAVAQPQADAIPLGPPVVDFCVTELHDTAVVASLRGCVEEWVRCDAENILRRRSGLAIARGYYKWKTNAPPSTFGEWYKPYFSSPTSVVEARRLIAECAVLIALRGETSEKAALANYVKEHCDRAALDNWALDRLGLER